MGVHTKSPFARMRGNTCSASDQGSTPSPSLSAASKKRYEKYEDLRVELLVIMFARVVDHLGFRHQIYEKLSAPEQKKLCQRLGDFNLFCEDVAVGKAACDHGRRRGARPFN